MAYIFVNKSRLKDFSTKADQINSRIKNINNDFVRISKNLDWDIKSSSDIEKTFSTISSNLDRQALTMSNMSRFFTKAYDDYTMMDSEEELVAGGNGSTTVISNNRNVVNDILKWFGQNIDKTFVNIAKSIADFGILYGVKESLIKGIEKVVGCDALRDSKVALFLKRIPECSEGIKNVAKLVGNGRSLGALSAKCIMPVAKSLIKRLPYMAAFDAVVETSYGIAKGKLDHKSNDEIIRGAEFDFMKGLATSVISTAAAIAIVATAPVSVPVAMIGAGIVVSIAADGIVEHTGMREKFIEQELENKEDKKEKLEETYKLVGGGVPITNYA